MKKENIQPIDDLIEDEDYYEDDEDDFLWDDWDDDWDEENAYSDYPCDNCSEALTCDEWEARFCCTLCRWYGHPDCKDCDPMDI